MNLRPLHSLICKDLKLFFSDRRAVVMSFVAPLILASFFAVVFGGGSGGTPGETARLSIRIADLDEGDISRAIVAALDADKSLLVEDRSPEEAREDVRKGNAVVAVILPEGFGDAASRALFGGGKKAELTLLNDPTHGAEAAMVRGILTQHVMQAVTARAFGEGGGETIREQIAAIDRSEMAAIDKLTLKVMLEGVARWNDRLAARKAESKGTDDSEMRGGLSMPFEAREEAVTAGNQEVRFAANAHAFGGMAVQFILFSALETGIALLTERQKGLWKRLRSAPISRTTLLLGRGLSGTIIALTVLAVLFGFGGVVFGVRVQGSVVGFLLVCLSFATTAASFGLLIAALGRTPQAARSLSVLAVLLMVMLGGAWVPTFAFPAWLQKLTPLIPTRWAVDGFDATLARGYTLVESLPTVAALFGFTAIFSLLAFSRFRWEEG